MKVLMINGSPRKDGNTALAFDEMKKMIEEIEEKAFMAGYEYAIEVLITGRVQKK